MSRVLVLFLLSCILFAAGCSTNQTAKDAWKYTKRQYYSYINTPATIDMEDLGSAKDYQLALSEHIMEVDRRVEQLIRKMENSDINPDQRWVTDMVAEFPWLSGVALVDETGGLMSQYPPQPMKPFDASPLLEEDPKQGQTNLRSALQQTPLGPEIYIGKPVYTDGTFRGLVVAHFDPAVLVQSCPVDSSQVTIVCPQGPIWTGSAGDGSLAQNDWANELANRSSGYYNDVYWTTRYFGNMPVVYAISTSASPSHSMKKKSGEETLDSDNAFAGGMQTTDDEIEPEAVAVEDGESADDVSDSDTQENSTVE